MQLPNPPAPATPRIEVASWIQTACLAVQRGRRASSQVAAWAQNVGLSETELRLLWALSGAALHARDEPAPAVETLRFAADQSELARKLVVSPAQISACTGRLDKVGLIVGHRPRDDRRRQLWRITDLGRSVVEQVIVLVGTAQVPGVPARTGAKGAFHAAPLPPAAQRSVEPSRPEAA